VQTKIAKRAIFLSLGILTNQELYAKTGEKVRMLSTELNVPYVGSFMSGKQRDLSINACGVIDLKLIMEVRNCFMNIPTPPTIPSYP
jgi:hypothetical protein